MCQSLAYKNINANGLSFLTNSSILVPVSPNLLMESFLIFSHMQEKGVMLQDHSNKAHNKHGAKALMNTIMQLR